MGRVPWRSGAVPNALLAWLYELTPSGIERDPADLRANQASSDDDVTSASTQGAPQRTSPELVASWVTGSKNFSRSFTIGRDESCEVHIDDPKISRRHVRIVAQHGTWYVEDLGSSNGTSLNGEMVTRAVMPATASIRLYDDGAEIRFQLAAGSGATTILAGSPDGA
jgi:pSer/pThr/pTyr-binding forkhead associated (FHA) protein